MRKVRVPKVTALAVVAVLVLCALVVPSEAGWAVPGVPSAPKSVKLVPGNAKASVTWQPPFSNGGHKVTSYKVIVYHEEVALAVNVFHSVATTQPIVGLKNGQSYTFSVSAKNSVGWSEYSARSAAVRAGIPVTPAQPTVAAGVASVTVTWKAPVNNGSAINWYRVTPFVAGTTQPDRLFKSTKTKQVVTALKKGKHYQFKVSAHNKYGWSNASVVSATVVPK